MWSWYFLIPNDMFEYKKVMSCYENVLQQFFCISYSRKIVFRKILDLRDNSPNLFVSFLQSPTLLLFLLPCWLADTRIISPRLLNR